MNPATYPILMVALVAFALGFVAGSMWVIWRTHQADQQRHDQERLP